MMNVEREDILIGRVASNQARDEMWADFERHAREHPEAWERLARALRDEIQIRGALHEALAPAESVDVTGEMLAILRSPWPPRLQRWSGWALAAVLMLAWVGTALFGPMWTAQPTSGGESPEIIRAANTDEAYREYIDLGQREGRIITELPKLMLELRTADESGHAEVYYIRQVIEKARVNAAYQIQRDELGRQHLGRINLASYEKEDL